MLSAAYCLGVKKKLFMDGTVPGGEPKSDIHVLVNFSWLAFFLK